MMNPAEGVYAPTSRLSVRGGQAGAHIDADIAPMTMPSSSSSSPPPPPPSSLSGPVKPRGPTSALPVDVLSDAYGETEVGALASAEARRNASKASPMTQLQSPSDRPPPNHGDVPSGKHHHHRRRISDFLFHRRRHRSSTTTSRHNDDSGDGDTAHRQPPSNSAVAGGGVEPHHYIPEQERRASRWKRLSGRRSPAATAAAAATEATTTTPTTSTSTAVAIASGAELPEITIAEHQAQVGGSAGTRDADAQELEALWEKRATALVAPSLTPVSQSQSLSAGSLISSRGGDGGHSSRSISTGSFFGDRSRAWSSEDVAPDDTQEKQITIEKAIQLHEENAIVQSTRMFEVLADPHGANNAIAQVFYGIAKRHGWGCRMDTHSAFHHLLTGATNAAAAIEAETEAEAEAGNGNGNGAPTPSAHTYTRTKQWHGSKTKAKTKATIKKTLGMALYELANCYRHAWGTPRDAAAARKFYELAANLGDTDAMCEAAWCCERAFGGKKDKYKAAQYYRLAMRNGVRMTGMSWIDKPKYQPRK